MCLDSHIIIEVIDHIKEKTIKTSVDVVLDDGRKNVLWKNILKIDVSTRDEEK